MADRSDPDVSEATLKVLLTQHEQLREGIRAHAQRRARRTIGGLSAAGLVVGYALAGRGDAGALALLPFVFGFLFFVQVESSSWIIRLASEICRIQKRVDVPEFSFESSYGIVSRGGSSQARTVAFASIYALLLASFLTSAVIGVSVVNEEALGASPPLHLIAEWLNVIYGLLLVLMLTAFAAHLVEIRRIRSKLWSTPDGQQTAATNRAAGSGSEASPEDGEAATSEPST